MKKIIYLCAICTTVILIYTFFYYWDYNRLIDEKLENIDFIQNANVTEEALDAAVEEEIRIKSSSKMILEYYYVDTNELFTEELNPYPSLVGLTRQEAEVYLNEYMQNLPLQEYEKGLISFQLISISKNSFKLRKVYQESLRPYKYFITLVNNYIVIFYSDKLTIYEYTTISADTLSDVMVDKLITGIDVKDKDELYDILAGLTS